MDDTIEKLKTAGLTGNESKIYLELLKRGESSANDISKKIGMDRTLTYTVLNNLIEKGMVSYIIKDKKKFFNASSPENLLNNIKKQEIIVQEFILQLKSIKKSIDTPQEINVYEGKEGVRAFFRVMLKHKNVDAFGTTGRAYDLLIEAPRLAKEFEKMDAKARFITHSKYKNKYMKIKNCETRYLDIKSEATTGIFGDYVSIHLIKDKPVIILIKNKYIAESYRNHFNVLWNAAKK